MQRPHCWYGLLALGIACISSCHSGPLSRDSEVRTRFENIVCELDAVERHLEHWGTLSMSAPIVTGSGDDFEFKLDLTDRDLYNANRNEGSVSVRESRARDIRFGGRFNRVIDGSEPDEAEEAPEVPTGRAVPAVGNPSADLPRYEGPSGIGPRALIHASANDRLALGLHKFLSNPDQLPKGMRVYFFAFTVSCRPGMNTRRGYVGFVDARMSFELNLGGETVKLSPREGHPHIIGVYPHADEQHLNLRSSYRQLRTAATQLAAAGRAEAATLFMETARRLEQDAETFSSLPRIVGYSHGGRQFGYEFHPTFRALEQPGEREGRPGFQLDPVSFPAVAIAVIDEAQLASGRTIRTEAFRRIALEALLRRRPSTFAKLFPKRGNGDLRGALADAIANSDNPAHAEAMKLLESEIRRFEELVRTSREAKTELNRVSKEVLQSVEVTMRIKHGWRRAQRNRVFSIRRRSRRSEHDAASQVYRLHRAGHELGRLKHALEELEKNAPAGSEKASEHAWDGHTRDKLLERWAFLQSQGYNLEPFVAFRLGKEANTPRLQVRSMSPNAASKDLEAVFVISGGGFVVKQNSTTTRARVELVGRAGVAINTSVASNHIVVRIPAGTFRSPMGNLHFKITRGAESVFTPSFRITGPNTITAQVYWENDKITRVELPKDVSADDKERLIKLARELACCKPRRNGVQKVELNLDLKAEKTKGN